MLLAAIQLVVGCTTSDEPSSARGPGALIAYVIPDNAPWWNAGQAGFTLLDGTSRLATWTKKRPKPSFGGMSSPRTYVSTYSSLRAWGKARKSQIRR